MTLRVRLALALAGLAALSVVAVAAISYAATAQRLHDALDAGLLAQARQMVGPETRGPGWLCELLREDLEDGSPGRGLGGPMAALRGAVIQCLDAGGTVTAAIGPPGVPADQPGVDVTDRPAEPADEPEPTSGAPPSGAYGPRPYGAGGPKPRPPVSQPWTQTIGGEPYRVVAIGLPDGGELRIARSRTETEHVLASLRDRSVAAGLGIMLLAAVVGLLVASRITRPVTRLTDAAEEIAATGRLDAAVGVGARAGDEIGRLAGAFSSMLAALTRARDQQQRLVQDAGHELRTPLTSLRANIGTLRRHPGLAGARRERLLADLDSELGELTGLVDELVALAVDRHDDEPEQTVALDALVERVADRARRRSSRTILVDSEPTQVTGKPQQLIRAAGNLLDNAVKFSPEGTPIEVTVHAGQLTVRDHGPGIDAADLPHVFERFHRAATARSLPGSGLGLAIVQQIVEGCGGTVQAGDHPDGGAVFTIRLPASTAPPAEPAG